MRKRERERERVKRAVLDKENACVCVSEGGRERKKEMGGNIELALARVGRRDTGEK